MNRQEYAIADRLPESLNRDNLKEVAQVIDAKLHELDALNELVCLYPRIDKLSSNLIDALAIQFHVDFYDTELSLEKRRALVKNSIKWHMRKGTKGAVQELIWTIWDSGIVREWFEYGGEPYHFKVDVLEAPVIDTEKIENIVKAINTVKNVRSWLDSIDFMRRESGTQYYAIVPHLHRRYAVAQILRAKTQGVVYIGGITANHKKFSIIQAAAVNDVSLDTTAYNAVAPVIHKSYKV